jgi:hypothetical protein
LLASSASVCRLAKPDALSEAVAVCKHVNK